MTKVYVVDAICENGGFRPLGPVPLKNGARVRLTILRDSDARADGSMGVDTRDATSPATDPTPPVRPDAVDRGDEATDGR